MSNIANHAKTAFPVVSAGEVRSFTARLIEATERRTMLVIIDQVGLEDGVVTADRTRDDLILGIQSCLALQYLTGRTTILVAGLPAGEGDAQSAHASAIAISNLVHSYINGRALSIENLVNYAGQVRDDCGRWNDLRASLERVTRFSTAHESGDATGIQGFTPEIYLMHASNRSTSTYEESMTRDDSLFGDTIMSGSHLWWSDLDSDEDQQAINPRGGEGSGLASHRKVPHLRRRKANEVDDGAIRQSVVLCHLEETADLDSLRAASPTTMERIAGLYCSRPSDPAGIHDGSFDYAIPFGRVPSVTPEAILSAAFALGDHIAAGIRPATPADWHHL